MTRTYLSIGDVLSLLREEFPDVTISKIRFLESQGLVNPERSPSGYRKFYETDVERLRWVLRQQRENFLPLKVIRDRLADDGEYVGEPEEGAEVDELDEVDVTIDLSETIRANGHAEAPYDQFIAADDEFDDEPALVHAGHASVTNIDEARGAVQREEVLASVNEPAPPPSRRPVPEVRAAPLRERAGAGREVAAQPANRAVMKESAPPPRAGGAGRSAPAPKHAASTPVPEGAPEIVVDDEMAEAAVSGVSLTLEELCQATGLSAVEVAAIEGFGLLQPMAIAGALYYDEEALTIAHLVAEFRRYGVEPRHLRLYHNFVEREMGLVEQIITPLLRQRNPESRQKAVETSGELASLGQKLRASLLRRELRRQLGT